VLEKGAAMLMPPARSVLNSTTAHARTHSLTHFLGGADAGFAARAANFPLPAKVARRNQLATFFQRLQFHAQAFDQFIPAALKYE
jgi:hypothetical protein